MRVDSSTSRFVDILKAIGKIICCSGHPRTMKIWEMRRYWRVSQLSLEYINLIQEKNDRLVLEPYAVNQGVEKRRCFVHLILGKSRYASAPGS